MLMKSGIGRVKKIYYGYFKCCPYCGCSGSDWGIVENVPVVVRLANK